LTSKLKIFFIGWEFRLQTPITSDSWGSAPQTPSLHRPDTPCWNSCLRYWY